MYNKILVPVDGSDAAADGLNEAIKLAKIHGSQLCLLHVVNELVLNFGYVPGFTGAYLFESLRNAGRDILDSAKATVVSEGIEPTCVMLECVGGGAAPLILERAREWKADLIVMGTHGRRGLARLALGSDAEQVVRGATVPVLLIRSKAAAKKSTGPTSPVEASVV